MFPHIPERRPVGDSVAAVLSRWQTYHLLSPAPLSLSTSVESPSAEQASQGLETLQQGVFFVRYALEYLGKPQYCIAPELVTLDYGDGMAGDEAFDFLIHKSNLYPRGDVFGWRNDGVDEMIVIKKLDLAQPTRLLVYADAQSTQPLAEAVALIGRDFSAFPPRLLQYAPRRFDSADAFVKYVSE